jgi:hypothetical protein
MSGDADGSSWHDAAIAGGALGLFSDFLFGATTDLDRMPLQAYASSRHPSIKSALELWYGARSGDDIRTKLADWAKRENDGQLETLLLTRNALNKAFAQKLSRA